jgi:hypothetical protein
MTHDTRKCTECAGGGERVLCDEYMLLKSIFYRHPRERGDLLDLTVQTK